MALSRQRFPMRLAAALAAAGLCSLAFVASASALPFTVNSYVEGNDASPGDNVCEVFASPGTCPLRAAIEESNATPAPDTIDFSIPGTISISFVLNVTNPLTIDGNGSGVGGTVVAGNAPDTHRLFTVSSPSLVTFKDLRLVDGGLTAGGQGGAIFASGDLTLDNVTLTSNQITGHAQGIGGAIYNNIPAATTTLINSTVSGNSVTSDANDAYAGGIYSAGTLNLTDSTVSGNTLAASPGVAPGAGIYAEGAFNIVRSAITGNTGAAPGSSPVGGGIYSADGSGTRAITNSTVSGNSVTTSATDAFGGGLRVTRDTTIASSTFANNTADSGADIFVDQSPTVTVKNTILASTGSPACAQNNPATLVSATPGNNIDAGTSCGFGTTNGNKENVSAGMLDLGPLMLNAPGATMTRALGPASVALNAATADCGGLGQDQRGVTRPQGPACDVGAFEREVPVVTPPASSTPPSSTLAPTTPTKKKCKKKKRRAAAAKKCKKKK
jgi:hypothetical protein